MNKALLLRVLTVVLMFGAAMLTGCCGFRLGPWGRPPRIHPRYIPPPQREAVMPEPVKDWRDLEKPLPPPDNAVTPIEDVRLKKLVVYFAYNRATIGTSERPKLETLAEYLRQHPDYCVVVEGHCDERGSVEYNRGLGELRAIAVKDYLVNLGIDKSRLETISYGEERPVVQSPTDPAGHAMNRRAEFVVGIRQK